MGLPRGDEAVAWNRVQPDLPAPFYVLHFLVFMLFAVTQLFEDMAILEQFGT